MPITKEQQEFINSLLQMDDEELIEPLFRQMSYIR